MAIITLAALVFLILVVLAYKEIFASIGVLAGMGLLVLGIIGLPSGQDWAFPAIIAGFFGFLVGCYVLGVPLKKSRELTPDEAKRRHEAWKATRNEDGWEC